MTIIGYFVGHPAFMQGISKTPIDPNPAKRRLSNQTQTVGGCTRGSEKSTTTPTNTSASLFGNVRCHHVDGTRGKCYDQISVDCTIAAGNVRVAAYDNVGGNPQNLLTESASELLLVGKNFYSVTEFTSVTDRLWLALQVETAADPTLRHAVQSNQEETDVFAFGAFPDPIGSLVESSTVISQSVRHST